MNFRTSNWHAAAFLTLCSLGLSATAAAADPADTLLGEQNKTPKSGLVPLDAEPTIVTLCASNVAAESSPPPSTAEPIEQRVTTADRPPYHGTIYVAPDIYLDSDPSAFGSLSYVGQDKRRMFDRRENRILTKHAHLFEAKFTDGLSLEVRVNPEFTRDRAATLARQYMAAFGQLPTELRRGMTSFSIHDGDRPFGGGGRAVFVHVGMGERYIRKGILTETLFHETVHATVDSRMARDRDWRAAQEADGVFISTYAKANPRREDLAETLLLSIALDQRPERLPAGMAEVLRATIPRRQAFFEKRLGWNIDPTARPANGQ